MTILDFTAEKRLRVNASFARYLRPEIMAMTDDEYLNSNFNFSRKTKQQFLDYLDKKIHYRSILN